MKSIQKKIEQSQFAEAINDCLLKLSESPNQTEKVELLYFLTIAYRYNKELDKALETTDNLIKLAPNYGRARQERGYIYLAQNQYEHATIAFADAVRINRALIASWSNLINLYGRAIQPEKQRNAQAQFEYLKGLPQPILGALELFHDGALIKSENLCRTYLQNNSHQIDAMILLAEIGIKLKIYDDAEFLLESCVELEPNNQAARTQYLNLLIRLGKFRKAKEQIDFLTDKQPNNLANIVSHGVVMVGLGEIEQGISLFKKALSIKEELPGVQVELGHALKSKGEFNEAVKSYKKAFKIQPGYGDAYWSLANTKTYRFTDSEIKDIRTLISNNILPEDDIAHLCFAIAKALEDRKEYDEAFTYYEKGNSIKKKLASYDAGLTD